MFEAVLRRRNAAEATGALKKRRALNPNRQSSCRSLEDAAFHDVYVSKLQRCSNSIHLLMSLKCLCCIIDFEVFENQIECCHYRLE